MNTDERLYIKKRTLELEGDIMSPRSRERLIQEIQELERTN
jgi:hypothetical protein